jgi:hypothetical protein
MTKSPGKPHFRGQKPCFLNISEKYCIYPAVLLYYKGGRGSAGAGVVPSLPERGLYPNEILFLNKIGRNIFRPMVLKPVFAYAGFVFVYFLTNTFLNLKEFGDGGRRFESCD